MDEIAQENQKVLQKQLDESRARLKRAREMLIIHEYHASRSQNEINALKRMAYEYGVDLK